MRMSKCFTLHHTLVIIAFIYVLFFPIHVQSFRPTSKQGKPSHGSTRRLPPVFNRDRMLSVPKPAKLPRPSLFMTESEFPAGTIVDANNAFGFKLCADLVQLNGGKNILISPLSVFTTLLAIYSASSGATFTEMSEVLGLSSLKEGEVETGFRDLIHDALYESGPQVDLKMLNAILLDRNVNVSTAYTETVRTYYNAYLEKVSFHTEPDYVLHWANHLVKWWTEGMITKIVSKEPSPLTQLLLINAIYFKGKWATVFDPKQTSERTFQNMDGTTSKVPMMRLESKFMVYCDNATYKICAIDVPYSGNTLSFLIFLPMENQDLSVIDNNMTPKALNFIINKLQPRTLQLNLPKFDLSGSYSLHKPLQDLGMKRAFSARNADLSKLGRNGGLYVQDAQHRSVIQVNEEGTTASGATYAVIGNRIAPPRLIVDKPFAFVIRNRRTNAILFLGRITSL